MIRVAHGTAILLTKRLLVALIQFSNSAQAKTSHEKIRGSRSATKRNVFISRALHLREWGKPQAR